jgi:hypothetical protein
MKKGIIIRDEDRRNLVDFFKTNEEAYGIDRIVISILRVNQDISIRCKGNIDERTVKCRDG